MKISTSTEFNDLQGTINSALPRTEVIKIATIPVPHSMYLAF